MDNPSRMCLVQKSSIPEIHVQCEIHVYDPNMYEVSMGYSKIKNMVFTTNIRQIMAKFSNITMTYILSS